MHEVKKQTAVFIDSSGKVFSIPSHSLPSARGMGEPISGRVNAESGVNFISALIASQMINLFLLIQQDTDIFLNLVTQYQIKKPARLL